jgi:FtsZ-interacting cell division protein ZipA
MNTIFIIGVVVAIILFIITTFYLNKRYKQKQKEKADYDAAIAKAKTDGKIANPNGEGR